MSAIEETVDFSGDILRPELITGYKGEVVYESDSNVVTVQSKVDPALYPTMWQMIREGFIELNNNSLLEQSMTEDELREDLENEDTLKYLLSDKETLTLKGFMTVHVGTHRVPWVDEEILGRAKELFKPESTIFYIGTIILPKHLRGLKNTSDLLKGSLSHFVQHNQAVGNKSICLFDRVESGHIGLERFVTRAANSVSIGEISLDVKEYWTETLVEYFDSQDGKEKTIKIPQNKDIPDLDCTGIDKHHYFAIVPITETKH